MSSHNDSFVASGSSPTRRKKVPPPPDFIIENHGTIFLFRMNTPQAVECVAENVQTNAQFFGDAQVVEHRYARDLAAGIAQDGLSAE